MFAAAQFSAMEKPPHETFTLGVVENSAKAAIQRFL
jgi:hypothetical protein